MAEKRNVPIKVYLRPRPLNKSEIDQKCTNIIHFTHLRDITFKHGYVEKKYNFDGVCREDASQEDVYNMTVGPMIEHVLAGFTCTVFAYGQRGSGKTHTIFGKVKPDSESYMGMDDNYGLIPRAARHLFSELSKLNIKTEYSLRVSFIEIYNEEVRDLLRKGSSLRIYDDPLNKGSVCIKDMSCNTVFNLADVCRWVGIGNKERKCDSTKSDAPSFRSHALFTFMLSTREATTKGDEIMKSGVLHLIDMAGSDTSVRVRAKDTGVINRSLTTFNNVIKALSQKMVYSPVRESKLTRIVQGSLGGSSRSIMILTFSPSSQLWDETIALMDFGTAARTIVNTPQMNTIKKQANILQEMHDEIMKLKAELSAARGGEGFYISCGAFEQMTQENDQNYKKALELMKKINDLENHAQYLDEQSRSLDRSHIETKEHLEHMQQRLSQEQEAVQLEEKRCSDMRLLHEKCTTTAGSLLNICENSTEKERVYYDKFQRKCQANITNAQVARTIIDTIKTVLTKINDVSQQNHQQKLSSLCSTENIFNQQENNKTKTKEIMHFIQQSTSELHEKLENLIEASEVYSLDQLPKFEEYKNKVDNVMKAQSNRLMKIQYETDKFIEELQLLQSRQRELTERKQKLFSDVTTSIKMKREILLQEQQHEEALSAFFSKEIARIQKDDDVLEEEASRLNNFLIEIQSTLDYVSDIANDVEKVAKEIGDLATDMEVVETDIEFLDNRIGENNENVLNPLNEAVEQAQNLEDNTDIWRNVVDSFHKNLSDNPAIDTIVDVVHYLEDAYQREQKVIQDQFKETLEKITVQVRRLDVQGHAGDTPARNRYELPDLTGLPNLNLAEEFLENNSDESCEQ